MYIHTYMVTYYNDSLLWTFLTTVYCYHKEAHVMCTSYSVTPAVVCFLSIKDKSSASTLRDFNFKPDFCAEYRATWKYKGVLVLEEDFLQWIIYSNSYKRGSLMFMSNVFIMFFSHRHVISYSFAVGGFGVSGAWILCSTR